MKSYILSLDQGTTSSRAIAFDNKGNPTATSQEPYEQIYPSSGWVEHDPEQIYQSQKKTAKHVIETIQKDGGDLAAIGITNQRETVVVWEKSTGKPIYNAIVWQDRRTAEFCDELKEKGKSEFIRKKTGLVIDAYFSGSKIKWILDHVDGARERAKNGEILCGTVDTWLVWRFTKGETFITDVSNASRTMLYNIHTLAWDEELLDLFDIPLSMLPEVKSSSEVYGHSNKDELGVEIPIAGIAGDQQAALFGQLCVDPGMVKNTYGTGCFLLMNTGTEPVDSENNLLTTIAWQRNGVTKYALEGSVFIGGAAVQWLRDELKLIKESKDIEAMATAVDDNDGVYFVPALTGLGAPHWDQYARGAIFGISRGTNANHIARATLEGIAYQVYDLVKAMEKDSGRSTQQIRVDGGAVANNFLMQFQSDIFQSEVVRPTVLETTALGAAYLAGLAVGFWKDVDELSSQWQIDTTFNPQITEERKEQLVGKWHDAVGRVTQWQKPNS